MSDAVDQEVGAIRSVLAALVPLPEVARAHVIDYVLKRLAISAPVSTGDTPSTSIPTHGDEQFLASMNHGREATPVHIKRLKIEKKPRSANEMAALVAYYLGNIIPEEQRKRTVNTKDIDTYFKIAEFKLPEQIKMTLPNAKSAGYFDAVGNGEYRLNAVGHNLVVHSMPRGAAAEGFKRSPRASGAARKKAKAKKSR